MATPTPPTPAAPPEPIRGYNFKLEVDGYTGYFHRCHGLKIEIGHIDWREGGGGKHVRRLAGPVELPEVTLCYGLIVNLQAALWAWVESAMAGAPVRKNPSILMLDHQGTEVMRYNLFDAFPVGWAAPDWDALGKTVAVESLTLVFERIERSV
jgi:phage tail-like protein